MNISTTDSVAAVPELLADHRIKTATATVEVSTSVYFYDAGVSIRVGAHIGSPGPLQADDHRTYVGLTFNLTPDECDELAAYLVAHAFDRRRVQEAKDAAFEARMKEEQA